MEVEMTDTEQSDSQVMAGPAKPRDERAIRHKMAVAITEADDLLRALHKTGHRYDDIRRVRGLLAEWRIERG
jgi:hypothetical protein